MYIQNGFLNYHQKRSERQSKLDSGFMTIFINFEPSLANGELLIIINDLGDSFNQDETQADNDDN